MLKILGVKIINFSREEINGWLRNILNNPPRQKFIVTLNPEIILKGYYDKNFRNILNGADLTLCDGFGVKLVARLKGKKIKSRYTGVDLMDFLLKLAKKNSKKVLIVVCRNSLSSPKEIEQGIEDKYKLKAEVDYFDEENFFDTDGVKKAEIVFVNFGAPYQEKFIFENRAKFPEARILVGTGGSFDFLTKKIKRAPSWMRKFGLEWLWRLIQEPKRLRRIGKAVVVFPALSLFERE